MVASSVPSVLASEVFCEEPVRVSPLRCPGRRRCRLGRPRRTISPGDDANAGAKLLGDWFDQAGEGGTLLYRQHPGRLSSVTNSGTGHQYIGESIVFPQ